MPLKFVIPPPNRTEEFDDRFFVSDLTHHPEMPGGTMVLKNDETGLSNRCCCLDQCPCLPELELAGFPDLVICFTSNGADPCEDCFASEVCITLTWNGINYQGELLGYGGCLSGVDITASLSCEGAGPEDQCRTPGQAPVQDVEGKWWVTMACDGCFWGLVTATSCDPFELSGALCLDGPDTIISKCCDNVMGFGIYGCVDFTVTVAP